MSDPYLVLKTRDPYTDDNLTLAIDHRFTDTSARRAADRIHMFGYASFACAVMVLATVVFNLVFFHLGYTAPVWVYWVIFLGCFGLVLVYFYRADKALEQVKDLEYPVKGLRGYESLASRLLAARAVVETVAEARLDEAINPDTWQLEDVLDDASRSHFSNTTSAAWVRSLGVLRTHIVVVFALAISLAAGWLHTDHLGMMYLLLVASFFFRNGALSYRGICRHSVFLLRRGTLTHSA